MLSIIASPFIIFRLSREVRSWWVLFLLVPVVAIGCAFIGTLVGGALWSGQLADTGRDTLIDSLLINPPSGTAHIRLQDSFHFHVGAAILNSVWGIVLSAIAAGVALFKGRKVPGAHTN